MLLAIFVVVGKLLHLSEQNTRADKQTIARIEINPMNPYLRHCIRYIARQTLLEQFWVSYSFVVSCFYHRKCPLNLFIPPCFVVFSQELQALSRQLSSKTMCMVYHCWFLMMQWWHVVEFLVYSHKGLGDPGEDRSAAPRIQPANSLLSIRHLLRFVIILSWWHHMHILPRVNSAEYLQTAAYSCNFLPECHQKTILIRIHVASMALWTTPISIK